MELKWNDIFHYFCLKWKMEWNGMEVEWNGMERRFGDLCHPPTHPPTTIKKLRNKYLEKPDKI